MPTLTQAELHRARPIDESVAKLGHFLLIGHSELLASGHL